MLDHVSSGCFLGAVFERLGLRPYLGSVSDLNDFLGDYIKSFSSRARVLFAEIGVSKNPNANR